MKRIGYFICLSENDLNELNHIEKESLKQIFKGVKIDFFTIHHMLEKNTLFKQKSKIKIVNFYSNQEGKLAVFKYVQENFPKYDYYLFSDCDIYLSNNTLKNMVEMLESHKRFGYTSARSLPIILLKNKRPSLIDKINYSKMMSDSEVLKLKAYGAYILFTKRMFLKKIVFSDITQINEDRWISSKYVKDYIPCLNSFFFYLLPNNILDRIRQQARVNLGKLLVKKRNQHSLIFLNRALDLAASLYGLVLFSKKKLNRSIWEPINSTKPSYYQNSKKIVLPKKYKEVIHKMNIIEGSKNAIK